MADDFDLKYKRQEAGITDKKTGKTKFPFDKATQTAKRLAKVSTIGKVIGIPVGLAAAAVNYAKGKRKEMDKESSSIMDDSYDTRQKLSEQGYSDEDISKMGGGMLGAEGMAEGGSVRGQKAIQVKKKPFKGTF